MVVVQQGCEDTSHMVIHCSLSGCQFLYKPRLLEAIALHESYGVAMQPSVYAVCCSQLFNVCDPDHVALIQGIKEKGSGNHTIEQRRSAGSG